MRVMEKLRKGGMIGFLVISLFFSSGCAALALLGIGGAAGYLIHEGEEADNRPKRKRTSQFQSVPSFDKKVDVKWRPSSEGEEMELIWVPGGIL